MTPDKQAVKELPPGIFKDGLVKITKENAESFGLDKDCADLTLDKLLNIEDAEFEVIPPKQLTENHQ
jgi:hypothetical protein